MKKKDISNYYIGGAIVVTAMALLFKFYLLLFVTMILIVAGKIRYPKNKILTILFYIVAVLSTMFVIYIIWLQYEF